MLWTAYVSGGTVPRGAEFVRAVTDLAARAGVDASPIERQATPDRRAELLEAFFELARRELASERGANAHSYLERRGFPTDAIDTSGLGVVPPAAVTRRALEEGGYHEAELRAAGILTDSRWPGRLCGAWRNDRGAIGTFWARALADGEAAGTRYLYLRGSARTNLPPYGLSRGTRELVLVEGFLDYHQLTARGIAGVAALGGTSTSSRLFEQLSRGGIESVVLCLDNDDAGREATGRAIDHAARARTSPAIFVVAPERLGDADDPDTLVRREGVDSWKEMLEQRECGVVWRAKEIARDINVDGPVAERRDALGRAGAWLGKLPPRLAIEQEDAVRTVAAQTGYSPDAVGRAFRARYWQDGEIKRTHEPEIGRALQPDM